MDVQELRTTEMADVVRPAHILVVDDSAENRELLFRRLSKDGHMVHSAEDGYEALDKLSKSDAIDLILLDVNMPGMSGVDVLASIKADKNLLHIPVIMVSAQDEMNTVTRCIEMGADDYLIKPYEPSMLRARLESSLNKKYMHDATVSNLARIQHDNAIMGVKIYQQDMEISSANIALIFAISRLAESRDPETGAHLERLREFCRELCQSLTKMAVYQDEVTDEFTETLFTASPLHDIGKVGIPDNVLLKAGKLDEQEFSIMRNHTVIGADTLREVEAQFPGNPFIRMGIEIAESHHERWDGAGYPYNLSGTDIPLSARILTVSDVYDALTSERCYKDAFSHENSMTMILDGTDKQFDPKIIDALCESEEEFIRIKRFFTHH
ncbi:MAG: response regulator [Gammaproteobacteria bacterium]|nr:response regulator [Gammaproteobacteria bacterium]